MNNLENSFKDALTDFNQISPSESMWTRISTTLLLKSAWFKTATFSLLALLLIGLPSYLFLASTNEDTVEVKPNSTELVDNNSNAIPTKQSDNSIASNTKHDNTISEISRKNEILTNNKPNTTNNKKTAKSRNSKVIASNNLSSYNNTSIVATEKTRPIQKNTISKNNTSDSEVLISTTGVLSETTTETETTSKGNKLAESNATLSSKVSTKSEEQEIEKMPSANELNFNNEIISDLDQFNYQIKSRPKVLVHNSLEVFAGPNIAFNKMNTTDNSLQDVINLRTNNESPKLSYHFGVNYKTYYKKWFMGLGVNYHRIEDRANYLIPAYDVESVKSSYMIFSTSYNRTIIGYLPNPNDTTTNIPIYKVTVDQDTSVVNKVHYDSTQTTETISFTNSYSYIEIPLVIGHEFNYRNFVFDISGGVSWNRLIKSEVNIPNEQGTSLISSKQADNILVKNTYNGLVGLGIGYRMNTGSLLFARPEIRYNLNSMFEKNYPISQKYIQVRISLGIRIKL
ncbi:MAG: hypothetical protein KAG64_00540 [Bacteroidales bacterium]|nr:hypothetical protein [Bacteroidales bacterium]